MSLQNNSLQPKIRLKQAKLQLEIGWNWISHDELDIDVQEPAIYDSN